MAEKRKLVDLGTKKAGAIDLYRRVYNNYRLPEIERFIGVDMKSEYKEEVEGKGYEFIEADILADDYKWIDADVYLGFDFLEHLPSIEVSKQVLKKMIEHSKFVWLKMPSFEYEPQLEDLGLRLSWTYWKGHPSYFKIQHVKEILMDVGIVHIDYKPLNILQSTDSDFIVPVDAPIDTHNYSKELGDKKIVNLNPPVVGHHSIIIRNT